VSPTSDSPARAGTSRGSGVAAPAGHEAPAPLVIDAAGACAALARADPVLGRHISKVGTYRLEVEPVDSLVAALARAIVYQQLTARAAATIHSRVAALGRAGFPTADELLVLDDGELRAAGLSSAKTRALKDLAARACAGALPTVDELVVLDDDAIIERLTTVRGIGPWTVQMLLMFRLGRPDVLPTSDYGVQKGFQRVFRTRALPTPAKLRARGDRWRPWRTVASWYLWRALDP
jgi:3-methyladenine DNA glycosylase/8-oxoguanine DNA glycosylase